MTTEKVLAPPPVSVPQFPSVQTTSLTNTNKDDKNDNTIIANDTDDKPSKNEVTDQQNDASHSRSPSQRRSRRRSYSYSRNSRSHSRNKSRSR
eukprot:UN03241